MLLLNLTTSSFRLFILPDQLGVPLLEIQGKQYRLLEASKNNKGFLGFFDWLRSSEENIIGVRICAFEHEEILSYILSLPYVAKSFGDRCGEIMFSNENYNENISGDQDFSNNYVYQSADQEYVITFGLDHLTSAEYGNLSKYCESIK